jgi:hypothetical protein
MRAFLALIAMIAFPAAGLAAAAAPPESHEGENIVLSDDPDHAFVQKAGCHWSNMAAAKRHKICTELLKRCLQPGSLRPKTLHRHALQSHCRPRDMSILCLLMLDRPRLL